MSSLKIHVMVAVVAVIVLGAFLPSHASTTVDEPAKYNPTAPAPSPSHSSPPPVQPVIVVQGVIYCKSCKLRGYNSNMDASPLPNATASLVCYGDEESNYRVLNQTSTTTDKNGYFLVMVYDVDMFDRHSCRLYLRSSPTPLCAAPFIPSNPKLGLTLLREQVATPLPNGARGAYHPKSALMYAPGRGGKCPPY
ncbi:non-classical arabinogalactan protein 31-like [Phragmites australis]|uniref:non-classical arabinogalactan protein 31-like n=1 Tax=Phragmites australis TaxID=29695 RepID=UPI002D777CFA|nr:non-classical arabinogalactan protein 31-like [Phragmites australis]XP_062181075.1 non-classical arabinogalactan protein 31-like [Phragmites australis]